MTKYSLDLPDDFEKYASGVEAKGWFAEGKLNIPGKRYRLQFYDPMRLGQEVQDELRRGKIFFEPNLAVIPSVTRDNMKSAIDLPVKSDFVKLLVVE